jgi:hypothetical protein
MSMENGLTTTARVAPTLTSPNPHVLWRQLLGLAVWVGIPCLLCGGPVVFVLGSLLGGLTFADAWISGIYKRPDRRAFSNISPMGWGIAMAMVLIVGYPAYIVNRNRLRTIQGTNRLYWSVVVLGGLVLVWCVLGTVASLVTRPS